MCLSLWIKLGLYIFLIGNVYNGGSYDDKIYFWFSLVWYNEVLDYVF